MYENTANRCYTRGESEDHTDEKARKDPPWFETQGRHHQKSKTGVPEDNKKDLCPPKI